MRGVYDYTIYRATRVGRRVLALLVAFIIVVLFSGDRVVAENKSEAENAMRLVGGTGNICVIDVNGKKSNVTSKMRLANGSVIATAQDSSAYVNLDSTKCVKLDALTKAEVRKRSGRYEVLLNAGNLFFNVTSPLAANETFYVRTSNMAMSIKGTCAQVEVIDVRHTRVSLLEGSLHCKITSLKSGESKTVILLAGQSADFYLTGDAENDCKIVTEDIKNNAIRGFVLQELYRDKGLAGKVFQQSGLDFRNLTESAVNQKLKNEKKKVNSTSSKAKDNAKKAIQMDFLQDHSEGKLSYTTEGNVIIVPENVSIEQSRSEGTSGGSGNQSTSDNNGNNHNSGSNRGKDEPYRTGSMKDSNPKGMSVEVQIPSPRAEKVVINYFDENG
ncbi:FecR domain-containing protein [Butyrivibrio sp. AE3004]|uniref:FecR domain-containing protein n=1 Tax=Butyrivibrio sp. AE3004 TaxID=1506994 RepID=UPI0004947653|nr:FecR domain-containing protein [Butyrivibrio sp. AE3004]